LRVLTEICEQHCELLLKRSGRAHENVRASLESDTARSRVVGLYQMRNYCSGVEGKEANLSRMVSAVRRMADRAVQILVFPEMCLPGYFTPVDGSVRDAVSASRSLADRVGCSPYLEQLQNVARSAGTVLAFGFCEQEGEVYYNSVGVIDADGRWLGARRKNPLYPWPYDVEPFLEPEPSERSAVFHTRFATVGVSICFDGEFPESIRKMRLDGAEILLWCNAACGDSQLGTSHRINHSCSYAQANAMWVVCCNCVAENASGTSVIVGPSGEPLVILPPHEEACGMATINLALSDDWDTWRCRLGPERVNAGRRGCPHP
jgi:N-carbamoylputrescine amidase